MNNIYHITFLSIAIAVVFNSKSFAVETNLVVLNARYDFYTVPKGDLANACLNIIGLSSIKSFQENHKIANDGVVGSDTWRKLTETPELKGVKIGSNDNPFIALTLVVISNNQICFKIHNRTESNVLIKTGQSLHQYKSQKEAYIHMLIKYSGEKNGRTFSGVNDVPLELKGSLFLSPHGSIKMLKKYRSVGIGATELKISLVATENNNRIYLCVAEPVLLREHVVFENGIESSVGPSK